MTSSINSFKTYIKTQSTALRISDIRNHKLIGKLVYSESNLAQIDFGHYNNSKITDKEIGKYFRVNRRLSSTTEQVDLLNSKISLEVKEVTPQESPILKFSRSIHGSKNFTTKLNSLTQLKRAFASKKLVHGRVVKKIKGGVLVMLLGFYAFLPSSHFLIPNASRLYRNLNIKKTKLLVTAIPLEILGIKYLTLKPGYNKKKIFLLNIVVSFRKALDTLNKHRKTLITKKLIRITKLKNCKKLKYDQ